MLKEQTFDTGAVTLNYVEGPPSGPPLVLLHGLGGWWQSWLSVMPALSMRWHLYALDLRGHGRSRPVAGKYGFSDYAQDVIAFLRGRVVEPTILIGHSLGAMTAIKVAAEASDMVRVAVLEDPPLYMRGARIKESPFYPRFVAMRDLARSGRSVEQMASALADILPPMDAAALRLRAKSLSQLDPDVYTPPIEGRLFESHDTDALLKRISAPVLLLQGDPALGAAMEDHEAEHAASLLSQGTFVRMPGVGHGIHLEQPEAFRRVVMDFLESL
jgi:pimeloyl-ACP methyl ester carboxylesterase